MNDHATAGGPLRSVPRRASKLNTQWALTPYINIPLQNRLQFVAEYSHRTFSSTRRTIYNDTFQVRLIFIQ